jgi:hypothetical protein
MNDNQKLKGIIRKIETDYQIKFEEMDWHAQNVYEYIIHIEAANKGQIRICITLLSGDIENSECGECHLSCDFLSGIYALDSLYEEFTDILHAINAPALRAKKLRDIEKLIN